MSCSRRSCSVLSSAQKQGSPDLSDRPRKGFKSDNWREGVLSSSLLLPPFAHAPKKLPELPFTVKYIKGIYKEDGDFSTCLILTGQVATVLK